MNSIGKWKTGRSGLIIALLMAMILLAFTGCGDQTTVDSSSATTATVEYDTLEKTYGSYSFQKNMDISDEEKEQFASLNETALEGNIQRFQLSDAQPIRFYVEETSDVTLSASEVHLPVTGVKAQSVNYASLGSQALLSQTQTDLWYIVGLAWSVGGENSEWQDASIGEKDAENISEAILQDTNGWLLQFNGDAYLTPLVEFSSNASFASTFVRYLEGQCGEEVLITGIGQIGNLEGILGQSSQGFLDSWLTSLSIPHGFMENIVFAPSIASTGVQTSGLDRNMYLGTCVYAYLSTEKTTEQALSEVNEAEKAYSYANAYINGEESTGNTTSVYFAMTETSLAAENALFAFQQLTSTNMMASMVQFLLGDPGNPWIQQGFPAMLQSQMDGEDLQSQAETLLKDSANQELPSMNRNVFEKIKDTEKISDFCTISGAFCGYLETTYGKEVLIRIYKEYLNFLGATSITFDTARYTWLEESGCPASTLALYVPTAPAKTIEVVVPAGGTESVFEEKNGYYHYESDVCIYDFEMDYMSFDDMWDFVCRNDQGILDVKEFLGPNHISYDGKVKYTVISKRGGSMSTGENIQLAFVKDKHAEYLHEDVHSIAGAYSPLWINEGFAVYVDQLLSTWHATPAGGGDLHELSKEIIFHEGGDSLLDFGDANYTAATSSSGQNSRMRAYILAASLVRYIDETYGREALLTVQADFQNCQEILEVDFETLKANWLTFLETEVN